MKKFVLIGLGVLLTVISCEVMNRNRDNAKDLQEQPQNLSGAKPVEDEREEPRLQTNNDQKDPKDGEKTEPHPEKPKEPFTQFDSKALDEKVIEEAKKFNADPKEYRMFIRQDPNGTKIYRMLGKHVIVHPNGEEYFLPDEI